MRTLIAFAVGAELALAGVAAAPAYADPQFYVTIDGPASLPVGLSGTYAVHAINGGTDSAPVQLYIVFAGALDQTGQLTADGGFDCTVSRDQGSNAIVRCATQRLEAGTSSEIVVQGRGSAPGAGQLVVNINPDRSVPENTPLQGGNDNIDQKNVTIT